MDKFRSILFSALVMCLTVLMAFNVESLQLVAYKPVASISASALSKLDASALAANSKILSMNPIEVARPNLELVPDIKRIPKVPVTPDYPKAELPDVPRPNIPRLPDVVKMPVPDSEQGGSSDAPHMDVPDYPEPNIPELPGQIKLPVDNTAEDEPTVVTGPVEITPLPKYNITWPLPFRKADLTVTEFRPGKNDLAYGEIVTFSFTIKNTGAVGAKFKYAFFATRPRLDPGMIGVSKPTIISDVIALLPGEEYSGTLEYAYDDSYNLVVMPTLMADFGNQVLEIDELDNVKSVVLWLHKGIVPVYTIADLAVDVSASRTDALVGEDVTFDVTVSNLGNASVDSTQFIYVFGDGSRGVSQAFSLAPQQTYVEHLMHAYASEGNYYFRALADPDGTLGEPDEMNNYAAVAVDVSSFVPDDDGNETDGDGNETEDDEVPVNETQNVAPLPVLVVTPLSGVAPLSVTLDGSASHDTDGTIVRHSWLVTSTQGVAYSVSDAAGAPGVVSLDFATEGSYDVMLVVVDDDGASDVATQTFVVTAPLTNNTGNQTGNETDPTDGENNQTNDQTNNQTENSAPVPVLSVTPLNGTAPLTVTIDGHASHDDGSIVSYSWVITGPAGYIYAMMDVGGVPGSLTRVFEVAGDYNIMLVVQDDAAVAESATAVVHVEASGITNQTGNQTGDGQDTGNQTGNQTGNNQTTGNQTNNQTSNPTTSAAPSISEKSAKDITDDSATIYWKTDINANSKVKYGTDKEELDDQESETDYVRSHSVELEDLEAQTKYYYKIVSCTQNSTCSEAGPYSFTTLVGGSSSSSAEDDDDGSDDDSYSEDFTDLYDDTGASIVSSRASSAVTEAQVAELYSENAPVAQAEDSIQVVYAPTQWLEVEDTVCKWKFFYWCLWEETVTRKVAIPALRSSNIQFTV